MEEKKSTQIQDSYLKRTGTEIQQQDGQQATV